MISTVVFIGMHCIYNYVLLVAIASFYTNVHLNLRILISRPFPILLRFPQKFMSRILCRTDQNPEHMIILGTMIFLNLSRIMSNSDDVVVFLRAGFDMKKKKRQSST